jgi:hypothetical protein
LNKKKRWSNCFAINVALFVDLLLFVLNNFTTDTLSSFSSQEVKMKFSQTASLAVLLQAAHLVNAQTPPGSQPSCEGNLGVNYNGTNAVETDMLLFPDRTLYHAFTVEHEISALTSLRGLHPANHLPERNSARHAHGSFHRPLHFRRTLQRY